ncbi:MAG: formate/nitrite transporter family protein [Gammaproteobacteria bacterium]|nr:formate/nitrite transporter family protein [Gammaproteobacteria bacterium]
MNDKKDSQPASDVAANHHPGNHDPESITTERSLERESEDQHYIPVIVKRTDQSIRHPDDTLQQSINEGLEQLHRHTVSLTLSSVAAGMILGFTAMVVGVVASGMADVDQPTLVRLATALVYPLGFIICIISGTQLFTEHTATAVYPVLDRKAPFRSLLRLWIIVLIGNLIGAAFIAGLLTFADNIIQAKAGYIIVAHHLVSPATLDLIISGTLAGWLMALGGWLIMSTQATLSQIVCIYIVTFLIGMGGLHHSIAGSVEMFTAYFISDQFSLQQTARFIGLAVLGNLIGGSIFVAILNYGHIRKTQELEEH